MVCSRQSIDWGGLWRSCCPSCQIIGAVRFEPKRSFLDSPRERRCSCAVDASGTSSSNCEEERPPEPITGFGSRAGTTNCDASGLGGFVRRYLSTRNLRITSNFFRCTMYLVSHSVLCHCLVKQHSRNDKKKKKKKLSDVSARVPHAQSWPRWAHSVSHTRVTVERGIKFGIDQNRDAAANCWRLAPVTHAGRAASSPEIFRPFLTVCLTVFPFEFRPRTFTIGFYGKKSFISELMILECSFPLSLCRHVLTDFTQAVLQKYIPEVATLFNFHANLMSADVALINGLFPQVSMNLRTSTML